jgi:hypothetical protein
MRTLISEVLLPASAAVSLLAMLTIPPATAEDRAQQPTATDPSAKPAIEQRCDRIERIGKFTITRCQ